MSEETYTLKQIKKAFWAEFHEIGELWFNYLDDDIENERSTNGHWKCFIHSLQMAARNKPVRVGRSSKWKP